MKALNAPARPNHSAEPYFAVLPVTLKRVRAVTHKIRAKISARVARKAARTCVCSAWVTRAYGKCLKDGDDERLGCPHVLLDISILGLPASPPPRFPLSLNAQTIFSSTARHSPLLTESRLDSAIFAQPAIIPM